MLKIYRIKQMSKSMFIYPQGNSQRIEFKGGTQGNNFHGQFSTSDEEIQNAVESHPDFGMVNTHKIYLSDTLNEDGQAVWGEEIKKEPLKVELKTTTKESSNNPTGFKDVKSVLISLHGVSPDELKNFKQVQKKIKDLNLDYVL